MKLAVSFSGGRTSAFMARWLQLNVSDKYELMFMFANTGCEHERTLEFVQECDDAWGLNVNWVEAVVNPQKRKGTKHRIVNFKTANRTGTPFEDVIKKFGIPNKAWPHCTRETKQRPMDSLRRELGFGKDFTAIGIRADEVDRMNGSAQKYRLVYPLVQWLPTTKDQILEWWSMQPFDLDLPEHYGNCKWCWKKSFRKLLTLVNEQPDWFDFPQRMETTYPLVGPEQRHTIEPRTFFRGKKSVQDLIEMAKEPFEPFHDNMIIQPGLFGPLDEAGGCSESCDIYAD
jgi:hypothetical protein